MSPRVPGTAAQIFLMYSSSDVSLHIVIGANATLFVYIRRSLDGLDDSESDVVLNMDCSFVDFIDTNGLLVETERNKFTFPPLTLLSDLDL